MRANVSVTQKVWKRLPPLVPVAPLRSRISMLKKFLAPFVLLISVVVVVIGGPTSAALAAPAGPIVAAQDLPGGYILVDNDTGNVLAARNEHVLLAPASTTKLLTALVAVEHLSPDEPIAITEQAASMPAMKIGVKAGEQWSRNDLLYSMLLVSANDAAVALGEAVGGDLAGFATRRAQAARQLGLTDTPVLNDPAGLDDEFSHNGGDRISAHDLAIVARAVMANNDLREIVSTKRYEFAGPDGAKHVLKNHNKMLGDYVGAIGMKTGYTSKARHTFVGAATSGGRTMIAIALDAPNPYAYPQQLMTQGFATPVSSEPTDDPVPLRSLQESPPGLQVRPAVATAPTEHRAGYVNLGVALWLGALGIWVLHAHRLKVGAWIRAARSGPAPVTAPLSWGD